MKIDKTDYSKIFLCTISSRFGKLPDMSNIANFIIHIYFVKDCIKYALRGEKAKQFTLYS